jgi:hypothetical protein
MGGVYGDNNAEAKRRRQRRFFFGLGAYLIILVVFIGVIGKDAGLVAFITCGFVIASLLARYFYKNYDDTSP